MRSDSYILWQTRIKKIIHANREGIIVFLLFLLLSLPMLLTFCKIFPSNDFDSHNLLTWMFASEKGLIPYRDFFYPYGLLPYFRDLNLLWHSVYYLILPMQFLLLFLLFKKLWVNKLLVVISLISVYLFVSMHSGFETFIRYCIPVSLLILFLLVAQKYSLTASKVVFLLGVLIGIVFPLMTDQGIYGFIVYIVFFCMYPILQRGFSTLLTKKYYGILFKSLGIFSVGVVAGIVPFLIYLFTIDGLMQFIASLQKLSDISLLAKVPFTPYVDNPENLFSFSITIIVTIYLIYHIIFKKNRAFPVDLLFGLLLILLLFEQKSLIRSIANQITFIAFIMLIVLLQSFFKTAARYGISVRNITLFYCAVLLLLLYKIGFAVPFEIQQQQEIKKYRLAERIISAEENMSCTRRNIDLFLWRYPQYADVRKKIRDNYKYTGKIYSFPGEPLFYAIFDQTPPFYLTIYEASAEYAQKERIAYMKKNNIEFIILNQVAGEIMDGVPNILRGKEELQYILENYTIIGVEGSYLFLKRNNDKKDFFENTTVIESETFQNYLLNIDLGSVPKSEGRYKYKRLNKQTTLINENSLDRFNLQLDSNKISSKDSLLILHPTVDTTKEAIHRLELVTEKGMKTHIQFAACQKDAYCLIKLSNIPLFYTHRILKKLIIQNDFKGEIMLLKENGEFLW